MGTFWVSLFFFFFLTSLCLRAWELPSLLLHFMLFHEHFFSSFFFLNTLSILPCCCFFFFVLLAYVSYSGSNWTSACLVCEVTREWEGLDIPTCFASISFFLSCRCASNMSACVLCVFTWVSLRKSGFPGLLACLVGCSSFPSFLFLFLSYVTPANALSMKWRCLTHAFFYFSFSSFTLFSHTCVFFSLPACLFRQHLFFFSPFLYI